MSRARILADYVSSGDELADKAPIASPIFTGTVQIPNISNLETAVAANTDKTGITSGQASAISANTSKTGITSGQASAISANTSKTGITSGQASAISANTSKTGITSSQASAISTNTSKVTNSTDASDLTSGTLPIARIADNAVDSQHYAAGSIDNEHLADDAVGTDEIVNDAVTADKLANSINTDIATGVTAGTVAAAALPKAGGDMSGDLNFGDNVDANFGSGGDLKIYHDGSHSRIKDLGTGNLNIHTSNLNIVNAAGSADQAYFTEGGLVSLYYNGSKKFETTNTGVAITGGVAIGGTGAANTLDDYEEGTFTMTLYGVTSHGNQTANYTKIGNMVYWQFYPSWSTFTAVAGGASGLPFQVANNANNYAAVDVWHGSAINSHHGYVNPGATTMVLISPFSYATATFVSGSHLLMLGGTYHAA